MTKLRWCASVLGAVLVGSVLAAPASAHDSLVSSDPPDGAVIDAALESVVLEFTGNVLDLNPGLQITSEPGEEVPTGPAQIEGTIVSWELTEVVAPGDYDVVWVVTSQDGHPIDGTFAFSVAASEAAEPDEPTASPDPTTTASPEATVPVATGDEPDAVEPTTEPEATPSDGPSTPAPTDPADISRTAEAWFFAGLVVTALVVVGVLVASRRNRDPNGPPGQS